MPDPAPATTKCYPFDLRLSSVTEVRDDELVTGVRIDYGDLCHLEIPAEQADDYVIQALNIWSDAEFVTMLTKQTYDTGANQKQSAHLNQRVMTTAKLKPIRTLGMLHVQPRVKGNDIWFQCRIPGWDPELALSGVDLIRHALYVKRLARQAIYDAATIAVLGEDLPTQHLNRFMNELGELGRVFSVLLRDQQFLRHNSKACPHHATPTQPEQDDADV